MTRRKIIFAGGGIGGLTALTLAKKLNIDCLVVERAKEYEFKGSGLSIMSNALLALREFGLEQKLLEIGQPMSDFQVRDHRDRLIFSSDFNLMAKKVGAPSVCLHRGDLQNLLLDLSSSRLNSGINSGLNKGHSNILMDSEIENFQIGESGEVTIEVKRGEKIESGERISYEADLLIGSDGIKSKVRELLEQKYPEQIKFPTPLRASGFSAWLATIPFHSPHLKPGTVIHYWGHGVRVGLIDIGRGRLYWWVTMNQHQEQKSSLPVKEQLLKILKDWPILVQEVLQQTPDNAEILKVETLDRKPRKFWGTGPVSLLGDAAHPSLTSLGQGAGLAIEDAVALMKNLSCDFSPHGLRKYEQERFARTEMFVNLARTVAGYEQVQNPFMVFIRNQFFRQMPQSVLDAQNLSLLKNPWGKK